MSDAKPLPPVKPLPPARPRRIALPVTLFCLTVCTTFFTGAALFAPHSIVEACLNTHDFQPFRRTIISHWPNGVTYTLALLGILLAHEMGHFVATLLYRIPASLPFFLPMPFLPGTLGAVIGMDGRRADRIQIFDIGLAGPLAGLVVAVPVMWAGVCQLDYSNPALGGFQMDVPLLARWMMSWADKQSTDVFIGQLQNNPLFLAGWVGFLITGLNMMPVSQLDGGHVIHSLFGQHARLIARSFVLLVIAYMVLSQRIQWIVMLALVMLMGPIHPPTRNDDLDIGWFRRILGTVSLVIPVLCFPPRALWWLGE